MSLSPVWTEQTVFNPELYLPRRLGGLVDFIAELRQSLPVRKRILPGGKVELAFLLDGSDVTEFYMGWDTPSDRGPRNDFGLVFSVSNRPQIVSARRIHILLVLMNPAAAMLLFGVPASEFTNRTVRLADLGIHTAALQDRLNSLPSFTERAQAVEEWILNRLRHSGNPPNFLAIAQNVIDIFGDGRTVPDGRQVMDFTGYSTAHANRLAKQWLGLPVERYAALTVYRKALALLNSPLSLAEVATRAGYFDQAHFTRRFKEYSGVSPGQYRLTHRTGLDTLHLD